MQNNQLIFEEQAKITKSGIESYQNINVQNIEAEEILPFGFSEQKVLEGVLNYLENTSLAPKDIKTSSQIEKPEWLFFPFVFIDSFSRSNYKCRADVSDTDDERANWQDFAGEHFKGKENSKILLVNTDLSEIINKLNWNFEYLQPFRKNLVFENNLVKQEISINDALDTFKKEVEKEIEKEIKEKIDGRFQDVQFLEIEYSQLKIKKVYLPLFVGSYKYRNKKYHYVVNGQTGEVDAESPLSSFKVILFLIGFVAIIIFAIFLILLALYLIN